MVYVHCSVLFLSLILYGNSCSIIKPSFFLFESKFWVYLGVRTCELFLCFVAIVRVRVYYVDFFVFFLLRHS